MSNPITCSNAVTLCQFAQGLFDQNFASQYNFNSAQIEKISIIVDRIYGDFNHYKVPEGLLELYDNLAQMNSFLGKISNLECLWIINKARLIMRRVVYNDIQIQNAIPKRVLTQLLGAYSSSQPALFEKILIENIVDVNARECCKLVMGFQEMSYIEILIKAGLSLPCIFAYENLSGYQLHILLVCGISMSKSAVRQELCYQKYDRAFMLCLHGDTSFYVQSEMGRFNFFDLDVYKIVYQQLRELQKQSKKILHECTACAFEDLKITFPSVLSNIVVEYHGFFSEVEIKRSTYMQNLLSMSCMDKILEIRRKRFDNPFPVNNSYSEAVNRVFAQILFLTDKSKPFMGLSDR